MNLSIRHAAVSGTVAILLWAVMVLPASAADALPRVDVNTDHIRGSVGAPVTIVEYTDMECPFCTRHQKTMMNLLRRYRGRVNWVYRPFPLSFHPNAMPEAEAAECVAELAGNDAFWKFHDVLLRAVPDGNVLSKAKIETLAIRAGADRQQFRRCIQDDRHEQRIEAIKKAGEAAGVDGTPANFVIWNKTGKYEEISGAQPLSRFTLTIDKMLKGTWKETLAPSFPEFVPVPPPAPPAPVPELDPTIDHIRGDTSAPYSLVLYAGANDPYSRRFYPELRRLLRENSDVNLVYRHFPLSFQTQSKPAAEAMECATEQGGNAAFWAYADALYEGTERWEFVAIARQQGLNQTAFEACLASDRYDASIERHIQTGTAAGVDGTPATFLLDHRTGKTTKITGAVPYQDLLDKLKAARAAL